MKKKLAILGASYLQMPLVSRAREFGIETHCFAWDNDEAVCRDIADFFYPISVLEQQAILETCKKLNIDGITTIATDICVPVICYVASKLNLISNTYESAVMATNKSVMREAFLKHAVNSPRSITVNNSNLSAIQGLNFPLIVKPTDRSGSRGVAKVYTTAELHKATTSALQESIEKRAVVEEFVEGDEISVESISWQGQHYILAITDKVTTGEPHFVELQHHQPSVLPQALQEKVKSETLKALDALNIQSGASHAEFKVTKEGRVVAIEIGARMGGDFIGSDLVRLSTGYDFLKGVIDVALNQFEVPVLTDNNCCGVYFLSKESEYLMPYFTQVNTFDVEKKILKPDLLPITNSNDRSGYLIYQADHKIQLS